MNSRAGARVAGIDLAAGRGVTEVACLWLEDEESRPVFSLTEHERVESDADIVRAVARLAPRVIAIDAPLSLPGPVALALGEVGPRGAEQAVARDGWSAQGWTAIGDGDESGEKEARRASPYLRAAEQDRIWGEIGARPLPVSFLGGLTFRAIALLPWLRAAAGEAAIIEVFPSGTAAALGWQGRGGSGEPRVKRAAKTAPERRSALQRSLASAIVGVPMPDERAGEPMGADLLDALLAALTAVAFLRGAYIAVGDEAEGQIVLPRR